MSSDRDVYYIFDKPVPFKDLQFYPVRMIDYLEFMYYSECLTLDKNSIPDVKIISMSYLQYIIEYSGVDNMWIGKLDKILRLSLGDKDGVLDIRYGYDDNKKAILIIDNVVINADEFDTIKDIICEQNAVEQEDYTVSKEVRKALKEAQEFKNKGGAKMGGLEDQMLCVISATSMNIEEVSNLTIRKFVKLLQRLDNKLHYQIYLQASMSGMVQFKDTSFIKHWMSDLSSDRFGGNLIDRDSIDKKLSNSK